jgi:hypothetical protein
VPLSPVPQSPLIYKPMARDLPAIYTIDEESLGDTIEHSRLPTFDVVEIGFAYKDFLTLWKDADPDIPILKQAKAEYAKLQ